MEKNIVILAAGLSSRMKRPGVTALDAALARQADTRSKGMIGLGAGQRPFMDYLLYNIRQAGYHDVLMVIGESDDTIRQYYGNENKGNSFHGLQISYAVQRIPAGRTKPLGTADALLQGLRTRPDWKGQRLTVCNSDNLYSVAALTAMRGIESPCALVDYDRDALGFPPERVAQFAVLKVNRDGMLVDVLEKPTPDEIRAVSGAGGRVGVSMNIFRLAYDLILPYLEAVPLHPVRLEKELPAAIVLMLRQHEGCVRTVPMAEEVPDLTARDDIAHVQEFLARHFPEFFW